MPPSCGNFQSWRNVSDWMKILSSYSTPSSGWNSASKITFTSSISEPSNGLLTFSSWIFLQAISKFFMDLITNCSSNSDVDGAGNFGSRGR